MAFVDLTSKKIYGCKKYSLVWWHELGHIKFSEKKIGNYHSFWQGNIFVLTVLVTAISLMITKLKLLAISLATLYIFFYIYEESWCWFFAFRNKRIN